MYLPVITVVTRQSHGIHQHLCVFDPLADILLGYDLCFSIYSEEVIMMYYKTCALILSITALFAFAGCAEKADHVAAVPQQDIYSESDGIVFEDDAILLTDGGLTVTITLGAVPGEVVFTHGDFHISSNTETMTLSEWNATDNLSVGMEFIGDNHMIETYSLNGHVMIVEHDGKPNAAVLPEFIAFYEDNQTTLSDDQDGWILNSVLEAKLSELIDAIEFEIHHYDGDPDKRPGWATVICGLAMLCAGIKCWFGAILNPWCVGCSGATMACAIIEWFGWW